MEPKLDNLVRKFVSDGHLSPEEAQELITEYEAIRFINEIEIKKWLRQHGYNIQINPTNKVITLTGISHIDKTIAKQRAYYADGGVRVRKPNIYPPDKRYPNLKVRDLEPGPLRPGPHGRNAIGNSGNLGILPRLPRLTPRRKQRLIWLAIVGPAAIASLILL